MSYIVELLRGAETYDFSTGDPYLALTLTGIGLPPVRLIKERGPQQHGSTVVGHLLDERMINLAVLIKGESEAAVAGYRDDFAEIVKPVDGLPIQLRITRADGTVRQIDTYALGAIDFPATDGERYAGAQVVVAQLEAPDPIPYDPALHNITFATAAGFGGYRVALMIPAMYTGLGTFIDEVESLVYAGKREEYPTIFITGPGTDVVITNQTTGRKLDFTGLTIATGETYVVDLRYGYKTVTDPDGNLANDVLTDDSQLVSWSLVPHPQAAGGVNDIHVVVNDASAATTIRMEYYDRYPSLG